MTTTPCILALFGLTSIAAAQSEVAGVDIRGDEFFISQTVDFVANYTGFGSESRLLYGIDWNADSTVLYGIDDVTFEIVTIDLDLGVSTPTGVVATGLPNGLTGMTASPDGKTWYVSEFDGSDTYLAAGDITSGVFNRVGTAPIAAGAVIDIAINSTGDLYGMSVSTDSLLLISTVDGVGTDIGPIGFNAIFAQGMDFDPATGELYAALYMGGGQGQFSILDLDSGLATPLDDTFSLNAEMEIAIRAIDNGIGTNYCDQTTPNSTGNLGVLSASGSDLASDNNFTLTSSGLPNGQFTYFVASQTQGFVPNAGGSQGNLCVVGNLARFNRAGEIGAISGGMFTLQIDLTDVPEPNGTGVVLMGETWNFQGWHRDNVGGPASHFTNGLSILFQ